MSHSNIAIFVPHNGCPHTCAFCNQRVISGKQTQPTPDDATAAVKCALASSGFCREGSEIAFFGGSFTAIERGYMISLLEAAAPFVRSGEVGGIRCSTRPDCIDGEVLDVLQSYGVTAIELGAQSMDDRVLTLNERGHTAQDVRRAAKMIKERGIELGLQMMTGLYGDSDDGAMFTARELAALEPATVRVYPTVVLRGTQLDRLRESSEFTPQGLDGAVGLCAQLLRFFGQRGIKVIRLGLHASRDIEKEYTGGAYHPALRELCESRLFLTQAQELLSKLPAGKYIINVNPRDVSRMIGQHRDNIEKLARLGYDVRVTPSADVPEGSVRVSSIV